MTKEQKQDYTLRITQANETGLVVIIYEILLEYLQEAQNAIVEQDKSALEDAIRKSRNCINELMQSVNIQYELGVNLNKLYFYCLRELATCARKQDTEALEHVKTVIEPLHEAYAQIAPENKKGPIMNNSQTVYAGLTYGRGSLMENMADQGSNRGMFV